MKALLTAGAAALALVLAACGGGAGNNAGGSAGGGLPPGAPLKQIAAPANGDWTQVVTATETGYRMGNPNARVRVVEYASITCPHCAEFSHGAGALTSQYVKSGQVSFEYRPHALFPTDPGIFALLHCRGAEPYFQLVEQLYADQAAWLARIQQYAQANAAALEAMGAPERAAAFIRGGELDQFFRQRGMPQAQIDSCVADANNLQRIADLTRRANEEHGISSTPTFMINDVKLENVGSWQALEPQIRAQLGG
ncbi:MAG TPA: thioredoxin domain-containing protein [Allosphingosinicella sp.]|nr:thioredoxin domain-containing protein [Allosphingosinicella sp.]